MVYRVRIIRQKKTNYSGRLVGFLVTVAGGETLDWSSSLIGILLDRLILNDLYNWQNLGYVSTQWSLDGVCVFLPTENFLHGRRTGRPNGRRNKAMVVQKWIMMFLLLTVAPQLFAALCCVFLWIALTRRDIDGEAERYRHNTA